MAKRRGASNLERLSDRNYFAEKTKSLMQGVNGGFFLIIGETFKIKSLLECSKPGLISLPRHVFPLWRSLKPNSIQWQAKPMKLSLQLHLMKMTRTQEA
jgi:hypothetical protein